MFVKNAIWIENCVDLQIYNVDKEKNLLVPDRLIIIINWVLESAIIQVVEKLQLMAHGRQMHIRICLVPISMC